MFDDYNIERVEEELADVLNYCLQMCLALNLNPVDIVNKKMDKNAIKYPVSKAKSSSKKYDEFSNLTFEQAERLISSSHIFICD